MWPYVHYGLALRADDVFWPTGDPSWGYGLCCYLPALAAGASVLCVEGNATPELCRDIIGRCRVSNLATTPTVLRSLMAQGDAIRAFGASVRAISSCGEPLNGEVVGFFQRVWGVTPMDHFGATEFGLPIGNHNAVAMAVKPGSMGLPAPGQDMAVVDEAGEALLANEVGLIAQRTDANSRYFLRYWNDAAATAALQRGRWTCTGDLGRRDADGYFWFEGRADDIIKSSGYRIGPFEIESAILRARRGGGGGGRRRARSAARPGDQGVRRAAARRGPDAAAGRRDRRAGQDHLRPPPGAARGRDRRRTAQDANRQDPALPAAAELALPLIPGRAARCAKTESFQIDISRSSPRKRRPSAWPSTGLPLPRERTEFRCNVK